MFTDQSSLGDDVGAASRPPVDITSHQCPDASAPRYDFSGLERDASATWIVGGVATSAVTSCAVVGAGHHGGWRLALAIATLLFACFCLARANLVISKHDAPSASYYGFRLIVAEIGTVVLVLTSLGFSSIVRTDVALIAVLIYLVGILCPLIYLNATKHLKYREKCIRVGLFTRLACAVVMGVGFLGHNAFKAAIVTDLKWTMLDYSVLAAALFAGTICLNRVVRKGARLSIVDPSPARDLAAQLQIRSAPNVLGYHPDR